MTVKNEVGMKTVMTVKNGVGVKTVVLVKVSTQDGSVMRTLRNCGQNGWEMHIRTWALATLAPDYCDLGRLCKLVMTF